MIGAFLASSLFVFLKAFQQRNVVFLQYAPVLPTSVLMAATEVYVVAAVVKNGWDLGLVLAVGLGAGCGCMLAMSLHNLLYGGKK